jgi:hypothetical protein
MGSINRIAVQAGLRYKFEILLKKIAKAGNVSQVVEFLPSKLKALNSNPSMQQQ